MTTKPNSLLIPVDFNEQSMIALEQSYNMAKLLGYEIVLLYVIEESDLLSGLFSGDQNQEMFMKINEKLEETAAEVSVKSGVNVTPLLSRGKVSATILKVAEDYNSRFILMGTNDSAERLRLDKNQIGANTSRVIRQSRIPVISINGKHHYNGCRSILLPLDLTKETRQKVTYAIEMAKLFSATIKVLSVLWDKNDKDIINQLQNQLLQVKNFIEEVNIHCQTEIVEIEEGSAGLGSTILDYARKQGDIDLVIIMTQQENRLVEFFIGSAAQQIIRQSEIPVMSIIPKDLGFSYYAF
ncbi:MAG: universal stress protein [Bacteroidales bacterium]|nr:universal stress protein [Bacteroidales bacterium]